MSVDWAEASRGRQFGRCWTSILYRRCPWYRNTTTGHAPARGSGQIVLVSSLSAYFGLPLTQVTVPAKLP